MAERVALVGLGARAATGATALEVGACARARVVAAGRNGLPGMAGALELAAGLCGLARLAELGGSALEQALGGRASPGGRTVLVLLALAEGVRPTADPRCRRDAEVLGAVAARAAVSLDGRSRVFRLGNAGFARALLEARALLSTGVATEILVGGVDSYLDAATLAWLEAEGRLGPVDADGIVPGEAAAFVRLVPHPPSPEHAVWLGEVAYDLETAMADRSPNVARAATHVVAQAVGPRPAEWVFTDVAAERHRVREWGMVLARGSIAPAAFERRLALDLGELGAASGAICAVCACVWLREGLAPGPRALVALHSEGDERGAFVIEADSPASWRAPGTAPPSVTFAARSPTPALGDDLRGLVRGRLWALAQLHGEWSRALLDGSHDGRVRAEDAICAELSVIAAVVRRVGVAAVALVENLAEEPAGPAWGFACVLALGCLDAGRALAVASTWFEGASAAQLQAVIEALALAPGDALDALLSDGLTAPTEVTVLPALEVAIARGACPLSKVVPLARHASARVRALALRALVISGRTGIPSDLDAAACALLAIPRDAEAEPLQGELAEALARVGKRAGLVLARRLLDATLASPGQPVHPQVQRAARVVALAGDSSDSLRLLALGDRAPACFDLLGWLGDAATVRPLVARLGRRDIGRTAESAIERALARLTGGGRGRSAPSSARRVLGPPRGAAGWLVWLDERPLTLGLKLRFGLPYEPMASVREHGSGGLDLETRARLRIEIDLAVAGAATWAFGSSSWLSRQREQSRLLTEALAERDDRPGAFLAHRLDE